MFFFEKSKYFEVNNQVPKTHSVTVWRQFTNIPVVFIPCWYSINQVTKKTMQVSWMAAVSNMAANPK
jgi:hypothetical protein